MSKDGCFGRGRYGILRFVSKALLIYLFTQAENADEWSYQKGLEGGWIPSDPTQRLYPGLCS